MSDQDRSLDFSTGDDCPRDCDRTLRVREFDVELPDDVEPEGPVAEAYCIHHGIVDQV